MLKSTKEPEVGDIELRKVIDRLMKTESLSRVPGPFGYTPSEYAYSMRAGNVYSLGVVLPELLTGKAPVSEGNELAEWALQKSEHEEERDRNPDIHISTTSPAAKSLMLGALEIAISCVSVWPEARPTTNSVLEILNQLYK